MIRTASDLVSLRASLGETPDPSRLINAVSTSLLSPVDTIPAGHRELS